MLNFEYFCEGIFSFSSIDKYKVGLSSGFILKLLIVLDSKKTWAVLIAGS